MILNFKDLEFDVLDNVLAKRYSQFLKEHVHETKEFYFMGDREDVILAEIDKIVYMLGKEPTRNMNKLHEYFADHDDEEEMSRLNNLIHYYELVINNFPPRWGMMNGHSTLELFPKDYEYFTLERHPGWLYISYPHVGKHFAEIAWSNDYNIEAHQYVPQEFMRPSFHIWLGDPLSVENINLFQPRLQMAHDKLKTKLDLPDLDDPTLRCGYIPFAKLKDDINTNDLTNYFLKCKSNSKHQWELFKEDAR
jgi:hypothetical protein